MRTKYTITIAASETAGTFVVTVAAPEYDTFTYTVDVGERKQTTAEKLAVDTETIIRESFRFLLERESPAAILPHFALTDIENYFPEYPEELLQRLRR